jgi:IS4 transposase
MDAMLKRFSEQAPVAVMARLGLQRAIGAEWVNQVFEEHSQTQYTRELLFSTVVELMSLVAVGQRPSLHAAAQKMKEKLPVSIAALYDKVNRVEPNVVRALVSGSAVRLAPVMAPLRKGAKPVLPGWQVRIIDGNHLPASEKRIAPLRGFRGAALPGHCLVVYDPDVDLVLDIIPCEDGHASERILVPAALASATQGQLWMGDRHFCTSAVIRMATERGAAVLFREHGAHPNPVSTGTKQKVGRVDTGVVYEEPVELPATKQDPALPLRRITLVLDTSTSDGDTEIRLLTTLPKSVKATIVAQLYRKRWSIEGLFGRIEAALKSEVRTLGQPRAALLAFGIAVVAYNALAVIQAAIAAAHDLDEAGIEISTFYVADDVRSDYRGMLIAIPAERWDKLDDQTPAALARMLIAVAKNLDPKTVRKHPRGPKKKVARGYAPRTEAQRHISTAKVMRDGRIL